MRRLTIKLLKDNNVINICNVRKCYNDAHVAMIKNSIVQEINSFDESG